jgi:hypothetical protein
MTDLFVEAIRAAVRTEIDAALDVRLGPIVKVLKAAQSPRLASVDDTAKFTGKSPCTIRRWEKAGVIKSVRRGGSVLIDLDSLKPVDADQIAELARKVRR